jgi:RNA ligase (TIGR02306 family)
MRTLVSIQEVATVLPIPEADAIEVLTMKNKGWSCVVKKDQFKPKDLCVYHEIDSLLPNVPQYAFLANGNNLKKSIIENGTEVEGYRLKTIRLRGQISQGLALPLSEFEGIIPKDCAIDTDLTQLLNVFKYEAPIPVCLAGELKGAYPGFLSKTDENRIQQDISPLEKLKGQRFYLTSKIDGTSSTFYKYENVFGACGHRWEYKESEKNIFWKLAQRYNLKDKFPNGFGVQGETAGEGIQKNRLKLKGVDFYGFYVVDIEKGEYLKLDDMKHFMKELGLKTVPIIEENFILNHTSEELLKMADMPSPLNPNLPQEGLVFRLYDSLQKVSFKVISNEYLIKHGL